MANLSKIKREKMLDYLEKLKEINNDNENIRAITEIENALNEKKYGLVWEEHSEKVDEELVHNIPIFVEDENRKITANIDAPYNFLLEGDNLHSLKLLEKTHKGKIDVIYIDPPYNTGNKDFIYDDCFVDKTDGYSHSKWLSFMEKRLVIARELLSNDGVIFISIDDNEQAQLKLLCDNIFGEENFIATITIENNPKGRKNSAFISGSSEYCIIYSKNKSNARFIENIPKDSKDMSLDDVGNYVHNSGKRVLVGENHFNKIVSNYNSEKHYSVYYNSESDDIIFKTDEISPSLFDDSLIDKGYTRYFSFNDKDIVENTYTLEKLKKLFDEKKLDFKNGKIYEKNMSDKIRMKSILINRKYKAIINNKETIFEIDLKTTSAKQMLTKLLGKDVFTYPKNISYIKLLISLFENNNITVLDFFAGSGTTGHAVMQLNKEDGGHRKYILCTNNENNICEEVTYQRLKNIQEDLPHNLKYYKTEFISKFSAEEDSISDKMLEHIKELIELEHHIELDGKRYLILEDEDKIAETIEKIENNGRLFVRSGIFLSRRDQRILDEKQVNVIEIPEYYFRDELKEVGEL